MYDIETAIERLSEQTILCIGDLMLDEFVYGEVSRVSPEAPVPVIAATRDEKVIGGAGNVARNIASLGARCLFVSVIGADDTGNAVKTALGAFRRTIEPHLVVDRSRRTTRKVRFVSEHYSSHLLRADWETAAPVAADAEAELIDLAEAMLPRVGAVVISDYAKGVLTPRLIRAVIDGARALGKPVVVDPKALDYAIYRGATVITPNRKELGEATRRPVGTDAELAAAAADLARTVDSDAVLVTLSQDGMLLHVDGAQPVHVPAYPVKIRDVSGAGDTVVAVLAALLAAGRRFRDGHAGGQRRRLGGGRQARHRDGLGDGAARAHPAARRARRRGEDRVRLGGRRGPRARLATAGPARRLHQRLLRHSPSRPRQGADQGARRMRPAGGRPQRRRLGAPAQGRGPARSRTCMPAPTCWRRSRRSIWWWCSTRTRRSN